MTGGIEASRDSRQLCFCVIKSHLPTEIKAPLPELLGSFLRRPRQGNYHAGHAHSARTWPSARDSWLLDGPDLFCQ